MNNSTQTLSTLDISYLTAIQRRTEKSMIRSGVILLAIIILSFFIPMKYFPRSRNLNISGNESIIEWFGYGGFPLFILFLAVIFYGINVYDHKYFKIKKDLLFGRKITFEAKVTSVSNKKSNHGDRLYLIRFDKKVENLQKLLLNQVLCYRGMVEGNMYQFEVTKEGKIPLSAKPINQVNQY